MKNTNWSVQDIKSANRGKSNLIDRFIYFQLEKLRSELWFMTTGMEGHEVSLKVVNEELEKLRQEISKLDLESLKNLKKDSLALRYFNTGDYSHGEWNKLIQDLGKSLETEYTQDEPRISKELLIWQNS